MIPILVFIALISLPILIRDISLYIRLKEISKYYEPICKKYRITKISDIHNITKKIRYVEDKVDITKVPELTLSEMEGDCEDIALVAYSLAKCSGYKAGIAILYSDDDPKAHAIAYVICPKTGEYYIFSNNDMFTAKDLYEATNMLGYERYVKVGD